MLIEHTIKKEKEINNKIKQKLVLSKSNNNIRTTAGFNLFLAFTNNQMQ